MKSLGGRIDMILDGGPCPGGIESTVVDVTGPVLRVLRPGLITVPMLEEVVGQVEVASKVEGIARSPGQMEKHYSPRTPLQLVDGVDIVDDCLEALTAGKRVGLLQLFGPEAMPDEPVRYAAELYSRLHDLDERGLDFILVEMPPDTPEWAAIRDRLTRAAVDSTPQPAPPKGEGEKKPPPPPGERVGGGG
jgi:L-threonylcarbamoyladenylate synthase